MYALVVNTSGSNPNTLQACVQNLPSRQSSWMLGSNGTFGVLDKIHHDSGAVRQSEKILAGHLGIPTNDVRYELIDCTQMCPHDAFQIAAKEILNLDDVFHFTPEMSSDLASVAESGTLPNDASFYGVYEFLCKTSERSATIVNEVVLQKYIN